METLTQTSLEIGRECWMEHHKGTFQGVKDGKYIVRIEGKNEVVEKHITYMPVPDSGWRPTETYKHRNEFYRFNGNVYCWKRDGGLKFYYGLKNTGTFKAEEIMCHADIIKLEVAPADQFLDTEEINTAIDAIDAKIAPLRNQANELHAAITNLEKEKTPIYAKCFHEWDKSEEEQYGSKSTGYRQLCACTLCGKEQYSYFSKF